MLASIVENGASYPTTIKQKKNSKTKYTIVTNRLKLKAEAMKENRSATCSKKIKRPAALLLYRKRKRSADFEEGSFP